MVNISKRTIEIKENPLDFIPESDIEFIWGSDVEVFPNFFYVAFENYRTGKKVEFEISDRKNEIIEFVQFYKTKLIKNIAIYFNGKHYDEVIIAKLLDLYNNGEVNAQIVCYELYNLGNNIINFWDDKHWLIPEIKDLKRPYWLLIDPILHWTRSLRITKNLSLKSLGIQLEYPVVQELPYDPHETLNDKQKDDIILYCKIHDLNILKCIVNHKKKDFKDRWEVSKKIGKNLMSANSAKLIKSELQKRLTDVLGHSRFTKDQTLYPLGIKLDTIIDKKIEIKRINPGNGRYMKKLGDVDAKCDVYEDLSDVFEYYKSQHVYDTGEVRVGANIRNPDGTHLHCIFASGGAHGIVDTPIIRPAEDEELMDYDIASMYPTWIINYNAFPKHLGDAIKSIYLDYMNSRLKAKADLKKGIDVEKNQFISDWYKLILNTFYGLLLESYGWIYDLGAGLTVTINGQLAICELAQNLLAAGINVVYINTDGITVKYKKDQKWLVEYIVAEHAKKFNVIWEDIPYQAIYASNVNNYIAFYADGQDKAKGTSFRYKKIPLGDSTDSLVIQKAVKNYFANYDDSNKRDVVKFITRYENILDFCISKKSSKKFDVYWNNQKQQRLNRFFICKKGKGASLFKSKDEGKSFSAMPGTKGYSVYLYNDHNPNQNIYNLPIYYEYYIAATNKIIYSVEEKIKQLSLF